MVLHTCTINDSLLTKKVAEVAEEIQRKEIKRLAVCTFKQTKKNKQNFPIKCSRT